MRFFAFLISLALISCSSAPEVRAVRAVKTTVEVTVTSVNAGTVKAEKVAELAFGSVGRVAKLKVRSGDQVKAGDVLAELENSDLRAALQIAEIELKRLQSLYDTRVATNQELDRRREEFEIARATLEKSQIRAPFDGFIAEVNLEVGQLAQITAVIPKPLIQIIDLQPRYVKAPLDEIDLSKVSVGLPARVKILAMRSPPFAAEVRKVVPFITSVREQDRTSEVELTIKSEEILLPVGASADVEIVIESKENALAIPAKAVLGHGDGKNGPGKYVFKIEDNRVKKVPVTLGVRNYERAEILSGLSESDIVALPSDSYELIDGAKVKSNVAVWP